MFHVAPVSRGISRRVRRPPLVGLALLAWIATLSAPGLAQEVTVLRDVSVIDGTGRPPQRHGNVVL
jgi:hypothetical protein